MRFFVGISEPAHAKHFSASFISVNRLRRRKRDFMAGDWIMDCAGFTELSRFGEYRHSPQDYAEEIKRWKRCGNLLAAVSQDYMCEPFMLAKTGLTVADHQRLTIERYRQLVAADPGVYIMPVLQGYAPAEYVSHIRQYGELLMPGMWVGVGSVCKRNANPYLVLEVIMAIHDERPDLRLHGFGLKMTALSNPWIVEELYTADSMAWNYAARKQGRDNNDYREALGFERRVNAVSNQPQLNMFMRTSAQ
jgi:hypothetical protein